MLSQKIDSYLKWKAGNTNKASYIYGGHLREFLNFVGDKQLVEITVEDVTEYRNYLHKNHKSSYVNYKMGAIRNFLRYNREDGVNCVSPFFIPFQRTESVPHYAITEGEYRKMLSVLNEHSFNDAKKILAIRLLWETGIRVSELCDLDLQDIDNPGKMALILSKKTKQKYWIFWSEKTAEIMNNYLGVRLCINNRPELLIASKTNKRPTTRCIERWIKETASEAKIYKKISPHSFRHGKAHYILDNGGDVTQINKLLGHSHKNLNSALNYTRLNNTEMSKIARKFICG